MKKIIFLLLLATLSLNAFSADEHKKADDKTVHKNKELKKVVAYTITLNYWCATMNQQIVFSWSLFPEGYPNTEAYDNAVAYYTALANDIANQLDQICMLDPPDVY